MERKDISKLQKNRGIHLKIGYILALSFVITAFNYSTDTPPEMVKDKFVMEVSEEIPVVRTKHEKPPVPPPPALTPSDEIIPDDPEFIEKLPPEPVKKTIDIPNDVEVVKVAPKPTVQMAPPPPMPDLPDDPIVEDDFIMIAEEMPRFPGCEDSEKTKQEKRNCANRAMLEFIYSKIKYPAMARENNVEGTVVIRFIVEKDGSTTHIEIVKDPGAGCGREAKRVVEGMPLWVPGKQRGRPVRVQYNLPVKFRLN